MYFFTVQWIQGCLPIGKLYEDMLDDIEREYVRGKTVDESISSAINAQFELPDGTLDPGMFTFYVIRSICVYHFSQKCFCISNGIGIDVLCSW